MANRAPNYILVTVLTLVTAAGGYWITRRSPHVSFSARLESIPLNISGWQGRDMEISKDIRKSLGADRLLSREYVNSKTGQGLGLLIVYRKYGRREFAHRPEMCYPAAGWEIVKKTYSSVPYAGTPVRARVVAAEREGNRELIAYWFASGERTEANFAKQQLWMALDRLQDQRYGWAFIRINVPALYGDEDALDLARAFLKDAGKPLRVALTGRR